MFYSNNSAVGAVSCGRRGWSRQSCLGMAKPEAGQCKWQHCFTGRALARLSSGCAYGDWSMQSSSSCRLWDRAMLAGCGGSIACATGVGITVCWGLVRKFNQQNIGWNDNYKKIARQLRTEYKNKGAPLRGKKAELMERWARKPIPPLCTIFFRYIFH